MTVPIVPGPNHVQATPPIPIVPPPAPAKRGLSQGMIAIITVGVLTVGAVGWFAIGQSWPPKFGSDATGDVTVVWCAMSDSGRLAEVDVMVHNTTKASHDYSVTVTIKDGSGVQIGTALAVVHELAAGGLARSETVTPVGTSLATCSVAKVTRT